MSDVVQWAKKVLANKTAPASELLEVRNSATVEDAQAAFHKIAKRAHPDLYRHALSPEDLELVTSAYSIVAGAYQSFRAATPAPDTSRPMPGRDAHVQQAAQPKGPASQMSSRALVYYRKAELALRRGELAEAKLQLKMAIAADPGSAFLRTALAEVEAETSRS